MRYGEEDRINGPSIRSALLDDSDGWLPCLSGEGATIGTCMPGTDGDPRHHHMYLAWTSFYSTYVGWNVILARTSHIIITDT